MRKVEPLDILTDTGIICHVCGLDHWCVDGTGHFPGSDGRHWLLCIGDHDEIVTADLPKDVEVRDEP